MGRAQGHSASSVLADRLSSRFDDVFGSQRSSTPSPPDDPAAELTSPVSFEIYCDSGGLYRWRAFDESYRTIARSHGGFVTRPGVESSVAAAQEARTPGVPAQIIYML